ncbi:hypothetical protein [Mycolicibacterium fallax]|uniref:hypothetical protein n=1 Tax=Mycolicibacterium fallax TaxID=1793 RepID=UPI0013D5FACB
MVDDHLKGCVVEAKAQVGNAGAEISHVTDAFARSVRSWKLAGSAQRCKQLLARLLATSAHFGANSAVFVALGVPAAFIPAGVRGTRFVVQSLCDFRLMGRGPL